MTGRGRARADTTVALVERAARLWPDAEALVDRDVRLTFSQLNNEVRRVTNAAMTAGLRPRDRVAIWAPNRWEWVVATLGLHAAGVVIVPLNTRHKGNEASYILDRSGARMLFTVERFLGVDFQALLEGHRTPVERTVVFGATSWDVFLDAADEHEPPIVSEDDLSDIIFTSGTTGQPKGVMSTHGQTVRTFRSWCEIIGLRAGDRYLVASPFFHTFGYKAGFIGALQGGATTYPLAVADAAAVLDVVDRERITMLPGTPSLFQAIFEHPDLGSFDISSLRLSGVGAASVPVELVERMRTELFDTVVTGYGLTESTGVSTMSRPDDPVELICRTVGRALPGVELRIVDESGRDVPTGGEGEILIRGDNVMPGYFDDPARTRQAIDVDGWLHTGDVGTIDALGYLSITDRLKDMFIVGGFNVYPAEIEAALLRHADIAAAAVVGMPDPRLGEVGRAFVVPRAGATPQPEQIIAWLRDEIANFKVPRAVEIVGELPMNAVGKVVKDELRARPLRSDGRQT